MPQLDQLRIGAGGRAEVLVADAEMGQDREVVGVGAGRRGSAAVAVASAANRGLIFSPSLTCMQTSTLWKRPPPPPTPPGALFEEHLW